MDNSPLSQMFYSMGVLIIGGVHESPRDIRDKLGLSVREETSHMCIMFNLMYVCMYVCMYVYMYVCVFL